jgi:hypothetical protein
MTLLDLSKAAQLRVIEKTRSFLPMSRRYLKFGRFQKVTVPRDIDATFVRMEKLEFIHQDQHFPVEKLVAHQVCDGLARRLYGNQLFIESNLTGGVLRLFISAVNGEEIELADENIEGLSALCREFQFVSFSRRLEVFKNTPTYRLEQRFNTLEVNLESLQSDVGTLTTTVTSLIRLENDIEKLQDSTGLLQSEVSVLRNWPSAPIPRGWE